MKRPFLYSSIAFSDFFFHFVISNLVIATFAPVMFCLFRIASWLIKKVCTKFPNDIDF